MPSVTLTLPSEETTQDFAHKLAEIARPGDCFLLFGDIGAGKSALARAFIKATFGEDIDVPSPTFTLVQTYESADVTIWHADLYRLGDTQEAMELGLIDAFDDAICLIEWPEILDGLTPVDAMSIHMAAGSDGHSATLTYTPTWTQRLTGILQDA